MEPAETQSLTTAPARPGRASDRVLAPSLQSRVERHAGVAAAVLIALVSAPYLLLLKSPLRLAGDEISYLSIGAHMAGGFPAFRAPHEIQYPHGYPALIAGLDRAGLDFPWAFVGLNLIFLALGLAATYALLRLVFGFSPIWCAAVCCLVVLSRVFVWTAAVAVTDIPFFSLATACILLLALSRRTGRRRAWLAIAGGAVIAGAAIEFRTVGVALLPPLVFACAVRPEVASIFPALRGRRLLTSAVAIAALALLGLAVAVAVGGTGYASAMKDGWHVDDGAPAVARQAMHQLKVELWTIGELALNVRRQRAPEELFGAFVAAGVVTAAIVLLGVRARRRRLEVTEIYVASIAVTLFLWPGNDARLWLPAVPLLIAYSALAFRAYAHRLSLRAVAVGAALVFAVIGAFTLQRSVVIGFAGDRFPTVWAETTGSWALPTYRLAFDPNAQVDRRKVRRRMLLLLRRYEPRARHHKTASTLAGAGR
jgi:hypothetical protein